MSDRYIAVIQAGGKGRRMEALTGGIIPKPMLKIEGKPVILWQMENISRCGIKDFVIITGHLGEKIEEYFGRGERFGFRIDYIREGKPIGSAGSLTGLKNFLADQYLVVFGDVVFDIDIGRMLAFHAGKKASATLLVHPNSHPYDSDIVCVEDGRVVGMLPKNQEREQFYHNCVNAGIYVLNRGVVDQMEGLKHRDMEKDVIMPLVPENKVYAYSTPEYVKDAGTPDRFESVCREKQAGVWEKKSLRNRQRCIFLDRDGTINKHEGLLTDSAQLELEENAAEAVRKINEAGYLAVVVTNQPVIARGDCTAEELGEIHKKLETLLGNEGAYVDALYYCPHHPDGGYPGERPEYKTMCSCRKPGTGMIEEAAKRFNIELVQSYMIGDTTADVMAGKNAGMRTITVRTGEGGKDGRYDAMADYEADDLLDAVEAIIGRKV